MVTILPQATNIGTDIGRGVQSGLQNQFEYQAQRSRLQSSLDQAEQMIKKSSPQGKLPPGWDSTKALLYATAGSPDQGKVLQALSPFLQQQLQTAHAEKVSQEGSQPNGMPPLPKRQSGQNLPEFLGGQLGPKQGPQPVGQPGEKFPTPEAKSTEYTNVPQRSTGPLKAPVYTGAELRQIAAQRVANSIRPTSIDTEYAQIESENKANAFYNEQIDKEQASNQQFQQGLLKEAIALAKGIIPDLQPEEEALFGNMALDIAKKTNNESERRDLLIRNIKTYDTVKNNAKNAQKRPNWARDIYRRLLGNVKSVDSAEKELRELVKPLTDLGLYDAAREIIGGNKENEINSSTGLLGLSGILINALIGTEGLGWLPVETESILFDVTPQTQAYFKDLRSYPSGKHTPEQRLDVVDNTSRQISDILSKDRDVNLVLLRDEFEKKNVDWTEFLDAFNQAVISPTHGQDGNQRFQLNPDQLKQRGNLNRPPLADLPSYFQSVIFGGK